MLVIRLLLLLLSLLIFNSIEAEGRERLKQYCLSHKIQCNYPRFNVPQGVKIPLHDKKFIASPKSAVPSEHHGAGNTTLLKWPSWKWWQFCVCVRWKQGWWWFQGRCSLTCASTKPTSDSEQNEIVQLQHNACYLRLLWNEVSTKKNAWLQRLQTDLLIPTNRGHTLDHLLFHMGGSAPYTLHCNNSNRGPIVFQC